ncbi:uncharacterized protein LOC5511306 isoform X2 [Nematostella vectensis]|uniref:uncharacterized protein LOC5511306 isoform X2 n=1 Tax=Nematostella vectensis TaxID=45351 RepID=UPI002076F4A6|nr:uncharacterized protein LOC5511306 isoform X2 [Nematostella vectensis]
MSQGNVFLFYPNIVGYFRLAFLVLAWVNIDCCPLTFLLYYGISAILDGVDGYVARSFNQTSAFGAWLDVLIDNVGRTMLWCYVSKSGWLVSCLEWLVFVCTHSLGPSWKNTSRTPQPLWVQAVMANGFKTAIGTYAITGLHVLPLWLYVKVQLTVPKVRVCLQTCISLILMGGRFLCMCVELWFVYDHICCLGDLQKPIQQEQQSQPEHRSCSPCLSTEPHHTPLSPSRVETHSHKEGVQLPIQQYQPIQTRRRSQSPGQTYATKRGRSHSPRRVPVSPRQRSNSPRRVPVSPRQRSNSPRRVPVSPRQRPNLPRRVPLSSRQQSNSPRRVPLSPRQQSRPVVRGRRYSQSPNRAPVSQRQRSQSPQRVQASPRRRSQSPDHVSPRRKSQTPNRASTSTRQQSRSPNRASTSSRRQSKSPNRDPVSSAIPLPSRAIET